MGIYEELGIRRIINGNATLTRLGGSLMPKEVLDAMVEAAGSFVDLVELQRRVGEEIAKLTQNEAAYVSCGCAAGMVLATAACITGMDRERRDQLPNLDGLKNEVIVHGHTRVVYDFAIRQVGCKLVEIGSTEGTSLDELESVINDRTVALFYFAQSKWDDTVIPIPDAVRICRERDVPIIVDAAAQLPPHTNLWHFTRDLGADMVLFSGGKGLCGPQASGLMLGRKELIEAAAFNGQPGQFIGRPMKVGKEELLGCLAAVRWYLSLNHGELMNHYNSVVQFIINAFEEVAGVSAHGKDRYFDFINVPTVEIEFEEDVIGFERDDILDQLKQGDPCIELASLGDRGVVVNPQTLRNGEEQIIVERLKEILEIS